MSHFQMLRKILNYYGGNFDRTSLLFSFPIGVCRDGALTEITVFAPKLGNIPALIAIDEQLNREVPQIGRTLESD